MKVFDYNDNAPILSTSNPTIGNVFEVYEETTILSIAIRIIAEDPDKTSSSSQTSGTSEPDGDVRFAIESCSCGNDSFIIDEITGDLSLYQ